jgi:replicative DNA helicase Mcm
VNWKYIFNNNNSYKRKLPSKIMEEDIEEDELEGGILAKGKTDEFNQEDLIMEAKSFFSTQKKDLGISAKQGEKVVRLNFDELSEQSPELAERLITKPDDTLQILEIALSESGILPDARVRLINLSASQFLRIRNIRAKNLNSMISVDGIVRQASEVRPRVTNARFECPACGTILSVLQIDEKFREPSRCSCGRRGGFKELNKEMVDAQRLVIEESPDALNGGEQPKRMTVFLKEDMVEPRMEERTTPGSKIKVIGVLKEVPLPAKTGGILTRFDLAIEANNIITLEESFDDIKISEEDAQEIKELSVDFKIVDKLAKSIAPSVWGYPEIKEALTLQLFGGVQKRRSDGTQTRGDLHVLLVGDPGVAKSVMLKFISGIAPKGRYVSGKSASGAGLTATVVKDEFLRGWALEAGAMVLSNKGLVCIDELEKMDENYRSTMHEAMEQQTVTISKANVQACYSEDTEVLTEYGWKKYSDVGSLKIAQFDVKKKEIKFLSHKGVFVYDYSKEMYHFKDKRNDILVTPNHKMLFREPRHKEFLALPAEEIKYSRVEFMNSGKYDNKGLSDFILPAIKHKQNRVHEKYVHQHVDKKIPISLWLEFLGYYVSEGGTETLPTVSITQKAGTNANKIEKCLKKLSKYVGFTLTKIPYKSYFKFK